MAVRRQVRLPDWVTLTHHRNVPSLWHRLGAGRTSGAAGGRL